MAVDQDAHLLQVGQELTLRPAADLASRTALTLSQAFSGDDFPGEETFLAYRTFF